MTTTAGTTLELELISGSTKPFEVALFREDGSKEDLSTADRASVAFRKAVSDASPYFARSTAAGNLAIDAAGAKLVASLSSVEADALKPGVYVGSARVRFGSDATWFETDPFLVRILPSLSPKV